jgi:hypothetical protein
VPQEQMKEFLSVCDDPNCNHPYCWSQRPSDPPIPREKRLEDALRLILSQADGDRCREISRAALEDK